MKRANSKTKKTINSNPIDPKNSKNIYLGKSFFFFCCCCLCLFIYPINTFKLEYNGIINTYTFAITIIISIKLRKNQTNKQTNQQINKFLSEQTKKKKKQKQSTFIFFILLLLRVSNSDKT